MQETDILLIPRPDTTGQALAADLQEWGYSTQSKDLTEVQSASEKFDRPYKLVIIDTDYSLEEKGCLFAETIHEAAEVPVLLLVDEADAADTIEDDRSVTVLRRPYRRHHLLRMIERIITAEATRRNYTGLLERLQDFTKTGYWESAHSPATIRFSPSLKNLLGLGRRPAESQLNAFLNMVHPDDQPLIRERYDDKAKDEPHHLEYRIIDDDGAIRYIRDSSFRRPDGQTVQTVGFLQDITEECANQTALQRCWEEMDEFAHIASHDLQEPLRVMSGFMQLLKSRYGNQLDDKGTDFINRSCRAGQRMELLIKELLKLARISSRGAPFELTDLNDILEGVRQRLAASQGEQILHITSCRLPQLHCDSRQITTLFQSIAENSLKFNTNDTPTLKVDCREKANAHHFVFQDNGIGIAEQFHHRVFTVFQRLHTDKEYPGLGTGLTKAKKIVERHGGAIWLESEPGKGSAIHFTLPKNRQYPQGSEET